MTRTALGRGIGLLAGAVPFSLLVGRRRPVAAAVACGLAVTGHNWSPFLGGAGGWGISPAMGALAVVGWPGSALLLAGLGFGRLAGETALGALVAQAGTGPGPGRHPGLARGVGRDRRAGAAAGQATGRQRPAIARQPPGLVYLAQLLYDRDQR
jgi:acyl phosphate:glycerol-3-phosphate acyltransferase